MPRPSKSQVNRSGDLIREWYQQGLPDLEGIDEALNCLLQWRAIHQYPLQKATMGLRSMVKTERCRVEVSQRLKRAPTMVNKLVREPGMKLARMQDIGGCRAVLDSVGEVRRVQKRLSRNRPPRRVSDYVVEPRASGYRGVHVIVEYDECMIEVQLRTKVMHEWAITVERLSGRLEVDLKSSEGPPEVLSLLQLISEAMAAEEEGEAVPQVLLDEIARRRALALPWLTGGRQ